MDKRIEDHIIQQYYDNQNLYRSLKHDITDMIKTKKTATAVAILATKPIFLVLLFLRHEKHPYNKEKNVSGTVIQKTITRYIAIASAFLFIVLSLKAKYKVRIINTAFGASRHTFCTSVFPLKNILYIAMTGMVSNNNNIGAIRSIIQYWHSKTLLPVLKECFF